MTKNFIPLFFLAVLGFSCNTEEYEVVPETKPEAPQEETTPEEPSQAVGSTNCEDCDYVIEPGTYLVDNNELNLPAGSTIGIKGQNRNSIYLINFHGTEAEPFLFVNCDGQTTITSGAVGIKVHESSFFRLTGTGSSDEYGIKITADLHGIQAEHGATNYEVDHIEIAGAGSIGFPARTNPDAAHNRDNFVQYNTLIHDNYVHDVGNEGIYVGGSHWHDAAKKEPELIGVRVYNNRVENTGYDGIQVGSAVKDSEIYNNVVINYGLKDITYHQSGLQINPGTTGKVYNNYVKGGKGHAIFLSGFGNDVYNNVVVDARRSAMYVADRGPFANQSYKIFNNTIVNTNDVAVMMTSSLSVSNIFYNNVLINTAGNIHSGSNATFDMANNFESAVVADAGFADAGNFNFTPTANSPLVDAGKSISIIGQLDHSSNSRISGGSIDIGAFEFQN